MEELHDSGTGRVETDRLGLYRVLRKLKKNNVSSAVSWFGFRVVSAELFSSPWTGTACVSAKRVWNIWAIPVD